MSKHNNIQQRTITADQATLRVREAEGDTPSRTIEGYAILFNVRSVPLWWDSRDVRAVEVIAPEAVTREFLDTCDIKFTMFHDRQIILARSANGSGTLSYNVDERGVSFSFDAPNTSYGDYAMEAVRRGDIAGCSFSFVCDYNAAGAVDRSVVEEDGQTLAVYTVHKMERITDMTLAADPAYPDTTVEAREAHPAAPKTTDTPVKNEKSAAQVAEMRRAAAAKI